MEKITQKNRVAAIQHYLQGIDKPISTVQAYEVLARALGHKNKHVLAAAHPEDSGTKASQMAQVANETVEVRMPEDPPLSLERMEQLKWHFDFIVPLPIEVLGDIDGMNDAASNQLTGVDYALEDISYTHVPHVVYPEGFVAYRVTAWVGSPHDFFDVDNGDKQFYQDLAELVSKIERSAELHVCNVISNERYQGTVVDINEDTLKVLAVYANGRGANIEEVNSMEDETVFTWSAQGPYVTETFSVTMGDAMYAVKMGSACWRIADNGRQRDYSF